ncbi:hypothetical protein [Gracilibacillus massiliensis]|uniref:hypothetical protein n=1 Tax=Gracilibacillus massiliensis TaxID=1564956 RepID=UPI00071E1C8F|nr:hypothetical protein [Gracilibacillus massiliensis]
MARVYLSTRDRLPNFFKMIRNIVLTFVWIFFVSLIASQYGTITSVYGLIPFVFLLGIILISIYVKRKNKKSQKAHEKFLAQFKELPDDYAIFQGVTVRYEKRGYHVPLIVLGPQAAFIIDTQLGTNHSSDATYHLDTEREVMEMTYQKRGKLVTSRMMTGLSFLRQQVWHGSKMWKSEGMPIWVQACVYIPDPNLTYHTKKIPVARSWDELIHILQTFQPPFQPMEKDRQKLVQYLKKNINAKELIVKEEEYI